MQENRSFDHMLGYLSLPTSRGGRARSDVDGLDFDRDTNPDRDGNPIGLRRLTDGVFLDNPGHRSARIGTQIGGGLMNGFVKDFAGVLDFARADNPNRDHEVAEAIMSYHTAATVPVYDLFAQHFTVCDRWHSAVPGPTWPNRMFLYAGNAAGKTSNGAGSLDGYQAYSPGMPTRLVVHELEKAGASWGVYRGSIIPWLAFFPSFRALDDHRKHVKPYRKFDNDCRKGDLPDVVFIDPNSNVMSARSGLNDDDQAPSDVARGQELIGDVYETLRRHGLLATTLFVVVYDEHGGFYDHVAPPPLPDFAQTPPDAYATYGVRVPALVVSGFVESRSVFHGLLDHTSILHSILLRFCAGAPMGARAAAANNLGQLLTRTTARTNLPSAADAVKAARQSRSSRQGNPDPSGEAAAAVLALLGSQG